MVNPMFQKFWQNFERRGLDRANSRSFKVALEPENPCLSEGIRSYYSQKKTLRALIGPSSILIRARKIFPPQRYGSVPHSWRVSDAKTPDLICRPMTASAAYSLDTYSDAGRVRRNCKSLAARGRAGAKEILQIGRMTLLRWHKALPNTLLGSRQEVLVVVMDNVDKLDLKAQLDAFSLNLWFMERTACFVILQMRDDTYERFKNKKPLDAFRWGLRSIFLHPDLLTWSNVVLN